MIVTNQNLVKKSFTQAEKDKIHSHYKESEYEQNKTAEIFVKQKKYTKKKDYVVL